ncbi:hypothetical protein [uncultured Mediterranean phage uvMED]|nr:hypothetical protein [uncultured Mediterranean phage uvMED]
MRSLKLITLSALSWIGLLKATKEDLLHKDSYKPIDADRLIIMAETINDSLMNENNNKVISIKDRLENIKKDSVKKNEKIKVINKKITSLKLNNKSLRCKNMKLNEEVQKLIEIDIGNYIDAKEKVDNRKKKGFIKLLFNKNK